MLFGLFVLLACQLVGDLLARGLSLPLPGPVIGIVLLAALLFTAQHFPRYSARITPNVEKASDALLAHLGLFFVPAGVGVSAHFDLVLADGLPLALTLLLSTLATLIVTVWVFILARLISTGRRHAG